MSRWSSTKAGRVLTALFRIGWSVSRQKGSHRILERPGWANYVWAFADSDELGPAILSRIAKHTGLTPDGL